MIVLEQNDPVILGQVIKWSNGHIVIIGTIFLFVPIAIIGSKIFLFWSCYLTNLIPLEQNDPVMLLELILLDRIIDMVDSIGSTIY